MKSIRLKLLYNNDNYESETDEEDGEYDEEDGEDDEEDGEDDEDDEENNENENNEICDNSSKQKNINNPAYTIQDAEKDLFKIAPLLKTRRNIVFQKVAFLQEVKNNLAEYDMDITLKHEQELEETQMDEEDEEY